LSGVGGALRTTDRARRAIEAQALATSRLDFMALLSSQELQALPDTVAKGTFAAPLNDYTWKTTSAALSGTQGLFAVDITINWPNGAYVVRTYMYRLPPLVAAR
jgi:hypothetical protein